MLKQNARSGEFTWVQLLLFLSVSVCGTTLDMAKPKKVALTQALATYELLITRSCSSPWPPCLNCNDNKRRREFKVMSFFCVQSWWPAFGCFHHISQSCHSPLRGWCHSKVTVKYERGRSGCQRLVARDKFNQKCTERGGGMAPCGTCAYALTHQAYSKHCQLTEALTSGDAHSEPHASVYVSVTLCLLSWSPWKAVKWTKCYTNKGDYGVLGTPLAVWSSCGNVNRDWDEKSVERRTKLLTTHFLSFPPLKLLLSQNILNMCRSYISSLVLFT